jgi:aryl-alcohol dehydrogenase-like predicted oxidoreductase
VSTVITGASRLGQLNDNLGALPVLERLNADVVARIDSVTASLADR